MPKLIDKFLSDIALSNSIDITKPLSKPSKYNPQNISPLYQNLRQLAWCVFLANVPDNVTLLATSCCQISADREHQIRVDFDSLTRLKVRIGCSTYVPSPISFDPMKFKYLAQDALLRKLPGNFAKVFLGSLFMNQPQEPESCPSEGACWWIQFELYF